MGSRREFIEDLESEAKPELEDVDGTLRWPELADSRSVGGWADELEVAEDSAGSKEGSEGRAAVVAAAAASAFLARCSRRSWRVVAFGCPSLSSSRDSGTVPKTCLKGDYSLPNI